MCEATPSALHNMSAPPRSVVDVRALRAKGDSVARPADDGTTPGSKGRPKAAARMPSGRFFARVHLVGLLHDGRAHEPCGRDIARSVDGRPYDLVEALLMLRRDGAAARYDDPELATLLDAPIATLHDEFVDRIRALGPMDLPPLLLARPRPQDGDAPAHRPLEPLVALRLLAGTAGGLFLRGRTPSVGLFLFGTPGAGLGVNDTSFDYYLPQGAPQR
jgi:hypothetical protein